MQSLTVTPKVIPKRISEDLFKILIFNCVIFAANWSGRFYVIAVDYDRYVIFYCHPFESNQRKSVPCERLNYVRK